MFGNEVVTVVVSFSTIPSLLTEDLKQRARKHVQAGEIHLAHGDQFGVRYLCKDGVSAKSLIRDLTTKNDFCTILTKGSDSQGNPILFAHVK